MQSLKPLRALGKQSKLMEIGHARHHKFKMFLLGRSLKSNNEYFWVGNVADEGADAFYMQGEPLPTIKLEKGNIRIEVMGREIHDYLPISEHMFGRYFNHKS